MARKTGARGLVPVMIMLLSACGGGSDSGPAPQPQNQPPVAMIEGPVKGAVLAGSAVVLDASQAADADGSVSAVQWKLLSGPDGVEIADPAATVLEFTVPDVTADTEIVFLLTVTDDDGATSTAEIRLLVHARVADNVSPSAQVLSDLIVPAGADVQLDARGSTDADGSIASYGWIQIDGPPVILGEAAGAVATFKAPDAPGTLQFRVIVTDNGSATDSDIVTVRVVPASANQPPQANIVALVNPVTEGTGFTLNGDTSTDETELTFAWTVPAGFTVKDDTAHASQLQLTGTPDVVTDTSYTFILVVSDGQFTAHTSTPVIIKAFNHVPEIRLDADVPGIDLTGLDEGASVTLTAKASDSDNHQIGFTWEQLDGDTSIDLPTGNKLEFTAPGVGPDGEPYEFRVTVTDEEGATANDRIAFNVNFVNRAPVAALDVDVAEESEGTTIMLSAMKSSDPDEQSLAYTFEQIDLGNGMPNAIIVNRGDGTAEVTLPDIGPELDGRPLRFRVVVDDQYGAANSKAFASADVVVHFVNQLPQLRSITATPGTVDEGALTSAVALTVDAFDADNQGLSYAWQVPDGFTATGETTAILTVTQTANVGADGSHAFAVNVNDGMGVSTFSVPLEVRFVNQLPKAVAGSMIEIPENADLNEQPFFLDGRASSDADVADGYQTLQYHWLVPAESGLVLDNAESERPRIIAVPGVSTDRPIEVTLEVSDGVVTETATTLVQVKYVNESPVVEGVSGPVEVEEGNGFELTASANDDLGVARYRWTVPTGFVIDPATREAQVLHITGTPDVGPENAATGITAEFSVVAIDEAGAESAPSSHSVHSMTVTYLNQLPVIGSVDGDSRVNARTNGHRLQANGSDEDGQLLTYTWTRIDTVTEVTDEQLGLPFTGQELIFNAPDVTTDETIIFRVIATDGMNASEPFDFSVEIDKDQDAPEVSTFTPAEPSLIEGGGLAFPIAVTATDDRDTNLDYDWVSHSDFTTHVDLAAPNVLIIDAAPNVGPLGADYPFSVRISDDDDNFVERGFNVHVDFVNQQPEITGVNVPATAPEGSTVTLGVDVEDDDTDHPVDPQTLAYVWEEVTEADIGEIFVDANGTATFTAPAVGPGGDVLRFQVTVNDQSGTENATATSGPHEIAIAFDNQPPEVTTAGSNSPVDEGNTVQLTVIANDQDGQELTYTWTQSADDLQQVDPAVITGMNTANASFAAPEFDEPTTLNFTVTVSDGELSDSADVQVITQPVNDVPVIENIEQSAFEVPEGDLEPDVTFTVAANDVDSSSLSYRWTVPDVFNEPGMVSGDDSAALVIHRTPNVTAQASYGFSVEVDDNEGGVTPSNPDNPITLTVNAVNQAPQITLAAATSPVNEGNPVTLTVTAMDGDGHSLAYTWEQVVEDGGTAIIAPITGAIDAEGNGEATFTAPDVDGVDFVNLDFTVEVDDGNGGTAISDVVTVVVNRVNERPDNVQIIMEPAVTSVPEGILTDDLVLTPSADDDATPADQLDFAWSLDDEFEYDVDEAGVLTITGTPDVGPDGASYQISVLASDEESESATASVMLTVEFVNQPPSVNIVPTGVIDGGEVNENSGTIILTANGSDDDGRAPTYTWRQTDISGVSLGFMDGTAGSELSFSIPLVTENTTFEVQVTATDLDDPAVSETDSISFTVIDQGDTPTVRIVPTPAGLATDGVYSGFPVTLQTTTQDMTGEINYVWSQTEGVVDANLGIDGQTGSSVSFDAPEVDAPTFVTMQVVATSGDDGANDQFSFTVYPRRDDMPLPFAFVDLENVPTAQSSTVAFRFASEQTIEGLGVPAEISIAAGGGYEVGYSVDGSPFTSAIGSVRNGQVVRVRIRVGTVIGETRSATLTIGGLSETFSVTTADPDLSVALGFGRAHMSWSPLDGLTTLNLRRAKPNFSATQIPDYETIASFTDGLSTVEYDHLIEGHVWALDWNSPGYKLEGGNLHSTLGVLNGGDYLFDAETSTNAIGYFKSDVPENAGELGSSVALSADGTVMAVGAPGERDSGTVPEGRVHIYRRAANTWTHVQTLHGYNEGDRFGAQVALNGDGTVLAISAPGTDVYRDADNNYLEAGEVYIYRFDVLSGFEQETHLRSASTEKEGEQFGTSISLNVVGDLLAVGVPFEQSAEIGNPEDETAPDAGAVYVFRHSAGAWNEEVYLKENVPLASNMFGTAVAMGADDRLFVSRLGVTRSVFVYERNSGVWSPVTTINKPIDGANNFGEQIAAMRIVSHFSGLPVFVTGTQLYERASTGVWSPVELPIPAGAGTPVSVAIADAGMFRTLAIGFEGTVKSGAGIYMTANGAGGTDQSGSVYVFSWFTDTFSWQFKRLLKAPNSENGDRFGECLFIDDDAKHIAVCAPGEDSAGTGVHPVSPVDTRGDNSVENSGAVYIY